MIKTIAKITNAGKHFEIMINLDEALKFKKGQINDIQNVLIDNEIFSDIKKGLRAGSEEIEKSFGTSDINKVAEKIIKQGNIEIPQEYRKKEQEGKIKQVIEFLSKNAVDPKTGNPHTPSRIESAIKDAGIKIDNKPVEEQITDILDELKKVIPIKIKIKTIKIKIPPIHTGKVYGLISKYKEKEEWLNDGSLECVVNIPSGIQSEFYDKLNSITHGSAVTEEVKGEENE